MWHAMTPSLSLRKPIHYISIKSYVTMESLYVWFLTSAVRARSAGTTVDIYRVDCEITQSVTGQLRTGLPDSVFDTVTESTNDER